MGLIGSFFSRILPASGPQAQSASAPAAAGVAYTINRLLGASSTLSLISGTDSNLALSGNQISATAAIASGSTQTAVVREVDGLRAVEYPVALTGTAGAAAGSMTPYTPAVRTYGYAAFPSASPIASA